MAILSRSFWTLGLAFLVLASACSASDEKKAIGSSSGAGGGTGVPPAGSGGNGGALVVDTTPTELLDGGRPPRCDAAGNCTCIAIGSLGKVARYGSPENQDSTDAFVQWMNTKSTAEVSLLTERTTITAELLANYDVLILQHLTDNRDQPAWTYTQAEIDAVSTWLNAGGAIIALTGYYSNNSYEIAPANQLLSPSGISYNGDDVLGGDACTTTCPANPSSPCCYCWGNSIPVTGWEPAHPVSNALSQVPALRARTINAPADAQVVATEAGLVLAVAKQVGSGRVFVFGDEWVTYTSQWTGTGQAQGEASEYNPCYDWDAQQYRTAATVFNLPQFWYNVIKWASPLSTCFDMPDEVIVR